MLVECVNAVYGLDRKYEGVSVYNCGGCMCWWCCVDEERKREPRALGVREKRERVTRVQGL